MKINGKHEVLAQTARRGLLLAALLAMVLTVAAGTRAQSSATPDSPNVAKVEPISTTIAQKPSPIATPVDATANRSEVSPGGGRHAAKGQHEGITVHGHWTIDVKNPDGRLAKHVEFENALEEDTGSFSIASLLAGTSVSGGMAIGVNTIGIKSGLLTGSFTTGSTVITPPNQLLNFTGTGPCTSQPGPTPTGCFIFQANQNSVQYFCKPPDQNCFPNMSISAPSWHLFPGSNTVTGFANTSSSGSTINLGGSFLATASNPVTDVESWIFICTQDALAGTCANVGSLNQTTPGATNAAFPGGVVPSTPGGMELMLLTTRKLDGLAGDPAQIPVTAGQTVSVNVALSFN